MCAIAAAGCQATPEKIETWKGTEKGPGKIREALQSASSSPEVRGLAFAALAEIGMLSDAAEDLKGVSDVDKKAIAHAAVPPLVKLAAAAGVDEPKRAQQNAKDGLFQVRELASPEDRSAIDDALVAWTTVDLAHRMSMGSHSSDKILVAIGARAGARLAAVLTDQGSSDGSRLEAARLLAKVGDKETREQAGAKLVEEAKAQRQLQDATLKQLGLVGGDHAVAWLTKFAEDDKQQVKARQKVLLALSEGGDPAALPSALRIAGDAKAPGEARDAAFELAEKIGASAVPGLRKLFDDKQEEVRWRAVEAALKAGGAAAVTPVLEGLSTSRSYPKDDLRSFVVHDLELLGPGAVAPLREELKSKSWVARISAVMALGRLGHAGDAAALDALAGDGAKLTGWSAGATVGSEAKTVAAELRSRR